MTQVISEMSAAGRVFEAFYFRTSDQYEADLVLEVAGELWALDRTTCVGWTRSPA